MICTYLVLYSIKWKYWNDPCRKNEILAYMVTSLINTMKVVAFSWKLLLDQIPTRRNLARRNCLPPEESSRCVLCGIVEESANHLFLHCNFTMVVWSRVMNWLDFSFITPLNLFFHWACWSNEGRNKRIHKGLWIIWHATILAIWQARNHLIFS